MEAPHNAGDWRRQLRREAAESARWQALSDAAGALAVAITPEQACAAVLMPALDLLGLGDGAVLARRGAHAQVMASHGRALPPGASLPLHEGRAPAWLLPPHPEDSRSFGVPITALGQSSGGLFVAWRDTPPAPDDLAALAAFAALLPAIVAEPPRAPRRRRMVSLERLAALSARERQVLSLLPRGLTNAALAAELGISPGTAKVHVERILHKLQVADRTQAAVYAVQAGVAA